MSTLPLGASRLELLSNQFRSQNIEQVAIRCAYLLVRSAVLEAARMWNPWTGLETFIQIDQKGFLEEMRLRSMSLSLV